MSKRQARKLHKSFRKAVPGLPFLLSAKLAGLVVRHRTSESEMQERLSEFSPEFHRSCTCCGLPMVTFTTAKGPFTFSIFERRFQ